MLKLLADFITHIALAILKLTILVCIIFLSGTITLKALFGIHLNGKRIILFLSAFTNVISDQLLWPGSQMSLLPRFSTNNIDLNANLYNNIMKDIVEFCDNLKCLHSCCKTHGE